MTQRNPVLKSPRKKNQYLRLMYITIHTSWRNNNHQGKGTSVSKIIMDQYGTRTSTNTKAHKGLKVVHGDMKVAQHQHGTKWATRIKIKVERKQLDLMFTFHSDGWMHVLRMSSIHCLVDHIVWLLSMFQGRNIQRGWNVV